MINWFKKSLEKNGAPDAPKITAFAAFCLCVVSYFLDQLTIYKMNETAFITFATIAAAGLGISALHGKEGSMKE